MAKKPRKKPLGTGVKKQPQRKPPASTVLTPLTDKQMSTRATELTDAALKPRLNEVDSLNRVAQGAHDTRQQQITGWANWQQGNLDKAFADTQAALNGLIATQGSVDSANRDSLMALLRQGTGSTDAAAQMVGTPTPTNVAPPADAFTESAKNAQMTIGAGAGGLMGYMGAQRELAGIGLQQNAEQERQRFNAQQLELMGQRKDIESERGGIMAKNMQDLRDFELSKAQFGETKANRLFQQYLAEKELDLKTKDQSFQQWLARQELGLKKDDQGFQQNLATQTLDLERQKFLHSVNIDWQNLAMEKDKVTAMFAQIEADTANAKSAADKEKAQLRGESMAKALEWLSGYLQPAKGQNTSTSRKYPYGAAVADDPATEKDESATEYQKLFADALRGMQQYTSKSDALRILMKSQYSDWRKRATAEYNRLKRRPSKKRGVPGYEPNPRNPGGGH